MVPLVVETMVGVVAVVAETAVELLLAQQVLASLFRATMVVCRRQAMAVVAVGDMDLLV